MKTAIIDIEGVSAISFSRKHITPELEGESKADYETRTWREKAHYDVKSKDVYLPGIMIKMALDYTAAQLGLKIAGRGNKTWKSIFESGVLCVDNMSLGVKRDDLDSITLWVNSDGRRGGGSRVWRTFPIIHEWGGTVEVVVLNDAITQEIFRLHLVKAGQLCGLGRYAPRRGGHLGRFAVKSMVWQDDAAVAAE